jgi:hypothetical protein
VIGLRTLGFEASEIHPVVSHTDGRPFVPTTWYGLDGYFQLSTSLPLDVCLTGHGVESGRLPLLRDGDGFSVHEMESVSFLGRLRPAGEVTAFSAAKTTNVFGRVGARFFEDATLALDPAEPCVAVGESRWQPPQPTEYDRFPHLGESILPLTDQFRFVEAPDAPVVALLASDRSTSYASKKLIEALRRRKAGRPWRTRLVLPSGREFEVTIEARDQPPQHAVDLGGPSIDLVIGMDLLRRGYTVFDWIEHVTWFGHYPLMAT